MLKKLLTTSAWGLGLAGAIVLSSNEAQADVLLNVDLSVPNQVTITATDGLSVATVSGSPFTGFYLADFYSVDGVSVIYSNGVGDLSTFLNPSDNSPGIFRSGGTDPGLNVWTFSSDATVDLVAGTQAFAGSATWTVTADQYADMIADGSRSGDVYFPADTVTDLDDAMLLGTYSVLVPAPGALALMGLGLGCVGGRRRRS